MYTKEKKMNRDNTNKTIFWSLLYIFLYSIGAVIVVLYLPDLWMLTVGIVGVGYILFNLFFVPYKRKRLLINGIFRSNVCYIYWNMDWKTA